MSFDGKCLKSLEAVIVVLSGRAQSEHDYNKLGRARQLC